MTVGRTRTGRDEGSGWVFGRMRERSRAESVVRRSAGAGPDRSHDEREYGERSAVPVTHRTPARRGTSR